MTSNNPIAIQPEDILFDRYRVITHIGQGGMANVYKAYDQEEQKEVALKILIPTEVKSQKSIERFRKEFSVMKQLSHPNIISAYNLYEVEQGHFGFSMEFIDGLDLDSMLHEEDCPISMEDKLILIEQVAEGLMYAHEQGHIHRDLKPANILVLAQPESGLTAKIADFGLTQKDSEGEDMSKSSNQIGTSYYMAPEQHRGEALTIHTDIYSFGILAFELFTGQKPFDGATPFSLFLAHVSKGIPEPRTLNPEIPKWVSTMIEICSEKDKKHRYKSMKEVVGLMRSKKNKKGGGFFSFFAGKG